MKDAKEARFAENAQCRFDYCSSRYGNRRKCVVRFCQNISLSAINVYLTTFEMRTIFYTNYNTHCRNFRNFRIYFRLNLTIDLFYVRNSLCRFQRLANRTLSASEAARIFRIIRFECIYFGDALGDPPARGFAILICTVTHTRRDRGLNPTPRTL